MNARIEQYVRAFVEADVLRASLTPEELAEANQGIAWARVLAGQGTVPVPKRRGRKVGSKNRKAEGQANGVAVQPQ